MKKSIQILALIIIMAAGIVSVCFMYNSIPVTYDGRETDVYELMNNPSEYDVSNPDGAASIIVKQNLDKTNSVNDVTSIVFDFRGYDTMGEAFILFIAVTGTAVILRQPRKRLEGEE